MSGTRPTPRIEADFSQPILAEPPPELVPPLRIEPRIEAESLPSPRLDVVAMPEAAAAETVLPPIPGGGLGYIAFGIGLLVLGFAFVDAWSVIATQFAENAARGWTAVGVAAACAGLIGTGVVREMSALGKLSAVDHLRADLASNDPGRARKKLRDWVAGMPEGPEILPAFDQINDPDALIALVRQGPVAALRARTDALARRAAIQTFAMTAAVPSPLLDGLLVAWRGVRLVREVAVLHGFRPGLFGTLALLRRTAAAAVSVMATDLALDAATRALLGSPLLRHVAGDVAGAGVAARRMHVLARAAARACDPLER